MLDVAREQGAKGMKVGMVTGDDILDRLDELIDSGVDFANLDDGRPISEIRDGILSANAYISSFPMAEALRRGCRYVGAIGSRKTQRSRRERLLERGLSEEELGRLRGPIGLDLGGREPAETALAIMSEVVASRYAASARPMVEVVAGRDGS